MRKLPPTLIEVTALVDATQATLSKVNRHIANAASEVTQSVLGKAEKFVTKVKNIESNLLLSPAGIEAEITKEAKETINSLNKTRSELGYLQNRDQIVNSIQSQIFKADPNSVADQLKVLQNTWFLAQMTQEQMLSGINSGDPQFLEAVSNLPSYVITDPVLKKSMESIMDTRLEATDPEAYHKAKELEYTNDFVESVFDAAIIQMSAFIPGADDIAQLANSQDPQGGE